MSTEFTGALMAKLTQYLEVKEKEEKVFRREAHMQMLAKERAMWPAPMAMYSIDPVEVPPADKEALLFPLSEEQREEFFHEVVDSPMRQLMEQIGAQFAEPNMEQSLEASSSGYCSGGSPTDSRRPSSSSSNKEDSGDASDPNGNSFDQHGAQAEEKLDDGSESRYANLPNDPHRRVGFVKKYGSGRFLRDPVITPHAML